MSYTFQFFTGEILVLGYPVDNSSKDKFLKDPQESVVLFCSFFWVFINFSFFNNEYLY